MKLLKQHVTVKSIGGIVLLLLVFFATVSMIGYNSFTEALLSQYSEGAFLTAETAARRLDADRMEEYAQSGGATPEYLEAWKEMDDLCNSTGATFIYVIQPDRSDYAHITFLFSTIGHDSKYTKYDFGFVRDTTNDEYRQKYRALYELEADRELVIRDRGYIETDPHITAMIGLKGADGQVKAILCVQRQMDVLATARQKYLNKIILALIVLVLLVILGQSAFLHRTLLQPLKQISDEAKRFSKENVKAGKKLQETIRNQDEIGHLAVSIDKMEDRIQNYIESITQITAEKERINTELALATRIQADMLPHVFPPFPDRNEFDLYASMDPAREVGGDFYDYFLVDDDHLCMYMADVSGKGVPAALFMMASMILMRNNARLGKSPEQILTDVNAAVCANNREEMFVTVWLCVLEISTGKLMAANAGHEYPALMRAGGEFELYKDKHGFVIGGMEGVRYKQYELQINPGDKLFLYTDGVPEATNAAKEMFGTERMIRALNEQKDKEPEEVLNGVRRAVDSFVKDAEQFDDLTMLCLAYRGSGA
ncbi:MAG: PP2C family protein-serine/threonine phosphatase [Clostridiales bacterium]|nr:PP2C family protein-serine/threonine phosphatase [Clostridiales bacterium]